MIDKEKKPETWAEMKARIREEVEKEHSEQTREYLEKDLQLAVVEVLEELELPSVLRDMVITKDIAMIEDKEERKKALTVRLASLHELFTNEVRKGVAIERKAYLMGHTPPASKEHFEDHYERYKRAGNVRGMVACKFEEYITEMDFNTQ